MLFEIYCREQHLTHELWKEFIHRLLKHVSYFDKITVETYIHSGEVLFYLSSTQDFSRFNNQLLPFILTPVAKEAVGPPKKTSFCYVDFSAKENVLALKEREDIRKNRILMRAQYTFHKLPGPDYSSLDLYFHDDKRVYHCHRRFLAPRFHFLDVDFEKSVQYKKRKIPLYVKLQKTTDLFSPSRENSIMQVLGFPYLHDTQYFPLQSFEYAKHSLIIGQTGTGKSKFIELYLKELCKQKDMEDTTIIVLDPHAAIYTDFSAYPRQINIDFIRTSCQLFTEIGESKIATELTILLFKTLMQDQFNPKMERVLKYSLFVLFTLHQMSLETLRTFLTDIAKRKEILASPDITPAIQQFFDTDFIEMETRYYEISIMPILTLLDELTFLPISNFQESDSLEKSINENQLVFLSLNQMILGSKALKLIAGLLIQQIFLLAQSRKINKKILFIIDEVSVVQNESIAAILSEARKFNLFLTLTQQYLQQVDEIILKSMLTNIYNYFIFKISEDDARLLANNLEFDFPDDDASSDYKEKGLHEIDLKVKMMTTLNPRECLIRVFSGMKLRPVFKAKTLDVTPTV